MNQIEPEYFCVQKRSPFGPPRAHTPRTPDNFGRVPMTHPSPLHRRRLLLLQLPVYRATAIGENLTADCDREEWWPSHDAPAMRAWFSGATN